MISELHGVLSSLILYLAFQYSIISCNLNAKTRANQIKIPFFNRNDKVIFFINWLKRIYGEDTKSQVFYINFYSFI